MSLQGPWLARKHEARLPIRPVPQWPAIEPSAITSDQRDDLATSAPPAPVAAVEPSPNGGPEMDAVRAVVGVDVAKNVFQA